MPVDSVHGSKTRAFTFKDFQSWGFNEKFNKSHKSKLRKIEQDNSFKPSVFTRAHQENGNKKFKRYPEANAHMLDKSHTNMKG